MLFSAANETMGRVISQSQKVVIAVAIMIVIANLSPQFIARFAVPLYTIGIVLLLGVAVGGEVVKGARRWLKSASAQAGPPDPESSPSQDQGLTFGFPRPKAS